MTSRANLTCNRVGRRTPIIATVRRPAPSLGLARRMRYSRRAWGLFAGPRVVAGGSRHGLRPSHAARSDGQRSNSRVSTTLVFPASVTEMQPGRDVSARPVQRERRCLGAASALMLRRVPSRWPSSPRCARPYLSAQEADPRPRSVTVSPSRHVGRRVHARHGLRHHQDRAREPQYQRRTDCSLRDSVRPAAKRSPIISDACASQSSK